jgi:trk system potassium uptake protein
MINRHIRKILQFILKPTRNSRRPTLLELRTRLVEFANSLRKICLIAIPLLAIAIFGILIYDAGFHGFYFSDRDLYYAWYIALVLIEIFLILYFLLELREHRRKRTRVFNLFLIVIAHLSHQAIQELSAIDFSAGHEKFILFKGFLYVGSFVIFITEISTVLRFIYGQGVNPSFLFMASFFLFIVLGGLLLSLPRATTHGIKPIDAWFTAASAVCVTGLTTVDTQTAFTHIGKLIILALIQIGGLGIMTFAGWLTFLSAGSVSFRNQLALKDMMSSNQIGTVVNLVGQVIVVTIFFEAAGAFLIYQTLDDRDFPNVLEKIFFSVFHSVSAFCNAGFSTFTNGLYEAPVRFNYSLHMIIAGLIVLGGMGFPIVFNVFSWIRYRTLKPVYKVLDKPFHQHTTHIFSATSKLALKTTMALLLFGFVTYLIFEWRASLLQHPTLAGKIITSIFGSITPRTAGFNTVNLTAITLPTLMVYLLLMWIGASPGSTGGGIKTTTFAVALMNIRAVMFGRERIEYSKTEIGHTTVRRAFAIMLLSLLVIGVSSLVLTYEQPGHRLYAIAFESFSAFGTVGLTLGLTPDLSTISKITLSIVMFAGRVGMLTLLFAFVTPARELNYRYPKEEITL